MSEPAPDRAEAARILAKIRRGEGTEADALAFHRSRLPAPPEPEKSPGMTPATPASPPPDA